MNPLRRAAVVTGLLVWLTAPSSGAGGQVDKMTPATATAIRSWVEAVKTHVPGRVDASASRGGQALLRATRRTQRRHGVLSPHPRRGNLRHQGKQSGERDRGDHISRRDSGRRFLPEASRHSPFGRGGVRQTTSLPRATVTEPRPPRSRTVEMRSGLGSNGDRARGLGATAPDSQSPRPPQRRPGSERGHRQLELALREAAARSPRRRQAA